MTRPPVLALCASVAFGAFIVITALVAAHGLWEHVAATVTMAVVCLALVAHDLDLSRRHPSPRGRDE